MSAAFRDGCPVAHYTELDWAPTFCKDCGVILAEANTDHTMGDTEMAEVCDVCHLQRYDGPGDSYYR